MSKRYFLNALVATTCTVCTDPLPPSLAIDPCRFINSKYYSADQLEDLNYYCSLPSSTLVEMPKIYWLNKHDYEKKFLNKNPTETQAPRNLKKSNNDDDNAIVSNLLNKPDICQFYSIISPSVQNRRVKPENRVAVVYNPSDMLTQCETMAEKIQSKTLAPCSSIEFAGHSTQSVGLDAIMGIDYSDNIKTVHPSQDYLKTLGQCLKKILKPEGKIIFSTCGGEESSKKRYHFWPKKSLAQQELTNLLNIPIISSIGPVHFSSKYGHNGSEAVFGWTETKPK